MTHKDFSGDNRERATPLPIPNREVKTFFADGTTTEGLWESRSLPDLITRPHVACPMWGFPFMPGVIDSCPESEATRDCQDFLLTPIGLVLSGFFLPESNKRYLHFISEFGFEISDLKANEKVKMFEDPRHAIGRQACF